MAILKNDISIRNNRLKYTYMPIKQPKGVKPEIRECELRSGVHWQRTLKQNSVKQVLGVF
jgi:hypothetical protein